MVFRNLLRFDLNQEKNTPPDLRKWIRKRAFAWILLSTAFCLAISACAREEKRSSDSTNTQAQPPAVLEDTMKYINATMTSGLTTLIAGKTGVISFAFSIDTFSKKDQPFAWDPNGGPAIIRVQTPRESGIDFKGKKGSQGIADIDETVFQVPIEEQNTDPLRFDMPYQISTRVRAKDYGFRLHATVPLVSSVGSRFQDSGDFRVPVRVETTLLTKMLVLIIIAITIFLFVVEWVRVDVVAILMMVSLPILNLLSSKETFTGLSSNAVIAIIGVMIVSAGLNKVGFVSRVMQPVIKVAGSSTKRLIAFLSVLIAAFSSVMQNTGAAALFLPGIRHTCREIKTPISSVLMPIGMCAILGGTVTMIGTSPLILLNDILPAGMEKFGLLELTPIGVGFVIAGILYFTTLGSFFLKKISKAQLQRKGITEETEESEEALTFYHDLDGPFELFIPDDYRPQEDAKTVNQIRRNYMTNIVAIFDRKGQYDIAPAPDVNVNGGYSLCVYGPKDRVVDFTEKNGIQILEKPQQFKELFNPTVAGTIEVIVSPRSSMLGSTIGEIGFPKTIGVTLLALYREGRIYYNEMYDIPLLAGDIFLLHATWEHFHALHEADHNFIMITPLEAEIQKPEKSRSAITCFLITLTLMLVSSFYFQKLPYNPIPLSVCLMVGGIGMILTGVLTIQEAYSVIDWRTIFLLGGLIPLGMAVDQTGTAEWIAIAVVKALGEHVTALVFLTVLAVMSGAFCLVISNVGACTLLVPLGVSMAMQIGVDPRVAAIVVGLGVSNSFLLPTHQVNALYMGPGDYRTKDYMKIGGILSLIYIIVLVSMTYFFYLK